MLSKTLITLTAITALGAGSVALAAHGGGGGGWRRRHDAWWRSRPHDGRGRRYGRSDDAWRPDDRRSDDAGSYDHRANHRQRRPGMERAHRVGRPLP
jgi:hypothetical protein